MTKCVAKELLQNLDFDALDFDQAKTIHAKLHVITPTLSSKVDYTNHDLTSLKKALLDIKLTYEKYHYDMSAFPTPEDVQAPSSYVINDTFPIDALSTLTQDQAMAMLTNHFNKNNLSGKTKTLHRKDLGTLILLIYDIIKELQSPNQPTTTDTNTTSKKQRIKENFIEDTVMTDSKSDEWPDEIADMYQLNYNEYLELNDASIKKYIQAYTTYFNVSIRDAYFEDTTAAERKQNLLETLVEFRVFEDKPILSAKLSNHCINTMDPIELYKELSIYKKVEHPDLIIADVTQRSIKEAREELMEARDEISMIEDGIAFEHNMEEQTTATKKSPPSETNDHIEASKYTQNSAITNHSVPTSPDTTSAPISENSIVPTTSSTTSSSQPPMTVEDMTRAIINFAKQLQVDLNEESLTHMSYTQLQNEYKRFRNSANTSTCSQKPIGKDPKSMTQKERLAQNLNGFIASKLDASNTKKQKSVIPRQNMPPTRQADVEEDDDSNTKVVQLERRILHIRPKLKIKDVRNVNATEHIKTFIQRMRKADPLIRILPLDPENKSAEDELESEIFLPDTEDGMKKWVQNIEIKGMRLLFNMRVSITDYKTVKGVIFEWCGQNGSYTNFTTKQITNEFSAGWLHGISANYYNRDHIQEYIESKAPHLANHVSVYAKEVFEYKSDHTKVLSYVVFIDGTIEKQHDLLEFLYTHKWKDQYNGVTFIAHNTSDVFTKEDRLAAIESHNRYLFTINRIMINVCGAQNFHNINDKLITFQEWLRTIEIDGERVFHGVEVAPNDIVRLIYDVNKTEQALATKRNLYVATAEFFGDEIASSMLNKSKFESVSKIYAKQAEYASLLRKRVLSNPQAPSDDNATAPPSSKKPSFYCGSYCEVTRGGTQTSDLTQDETTVVNDLSKRFNALVKRQEELEKQMPVQIATEVSQTVTKQLQPLTQELRDHKEATSTSIAQILKAITSLRDSQNTQLDGLIKSLTQETPSGAKQESSRGGGK